MVVALNGFVLAAGLAGFLAWPAFAQAPVVAVPVVPSSQPGEGVDRQAAYAPLPGGGFVLVYSRYERGDIDSSVLRVAVSSDGSTISRDEPLTFGGAIEDAPSFVTTGDDTWLYFASGDEDGETIELWRSRVTGTAFAAPERLPDVPGLERLAQWPRWVDVGDEVFLTFRGRKSKPSWIRLQDGVPQGDPHPVGPGAVAYPRVVPMTGGGCFFSYQRPPDGGYMATYFSVSDDCTGWSPPEPLSWPDAPHKPDVHDAFALPRLDAGVDVYYVYPARKGPDARFDVGFVLYRRAVMPDGRMGPEEQLTERDAFEPFAPTAHRQPDGSILVTFSDIHATGANGVSSACMTFFELASDAAAPAT